MTFTLLLRRSSVAGHVPSTSQLSLGEVAMNTNDGLLYYVKNVAGANSIVCLGPVPQTANALTNAVTLALSGDASGSVSFNGANNVTISTTLATVNSNIGNFNNVTVNGKGLVTSASNVAYITNMVASGDVTGTSTGNAITLTLATVNANVGTFNTLTVNGKGLITSASNTPYITNVIASGDASGTSTGNALALTFASVNSNVGTFGTGTIVPTITVNAKGLVTAVANTAIIFPVTSVFGRTGTVTLQSSDVTGALGYIPVNNAVLGVANGVATLNSLGQLTASQLPASITGALVYQGVWNANTNSPTLVSGTGTKGWYYKVSVPGSTTIDGISQWNVGDSIVFDGTTWDKIDGISSEVVSVAGRIGNVVLAVSDISGAAPLASPALTGVPTAPTPASSDSSTTISTTAFVKAQNYTVGPVVASGDVSGTASGNAITLTLATINSNVGTFTAVTVNGKGQVTAAANMVFSGDASGTTVNAATTLTLATVNSNVGTFGNAIQVPMITVNAKGLVTSISNSAIAFPVTTVFGRTGAVILQSSDVTGALGFTPVNNAVVGVANGVATLNASGQLTQSQLPSSTLYGSIVATGDVSGTSVGNAITLTLPVVNSNVGTFVGQVVINAKGQVTAAANVYTFSQYGLGIGIGPDIVDGGSF